MPDGFDRSSRGHTSGIHNGVKRLSPTGGRPFYVPYFAEGCFDVDAPGFGGHA